MGKNCNRTRRCSVAAQPFLPQPPAAPHSPRPRLCKPPVLGESPQAAGRGFDPRQLNRAQLALAGLWVAACRSTPGDSGQDCAVAGQDELKAGVRAGSSGKSQTAADLPRRLGYSRIHSERKGKVSRATWEHDPPHGCCGSLCSLALGERAADFRPSLRAGGNTRSARRDSLGCGGYEPQRRLWSEAFPCGYKEELVRLRHGPRNTSTPRQWEILKAQTNIRQEWGGSKQILPLLCSWGWDRLGPWGSRIS